MSLVSLSLHSLNYNVLKAEFSEINFSFVDDVRKLWPDLGGAKKKKRRRRVRSHKINYPEENSSAVIIKPAFLSPSLPSSPLPSTLPSFFFPDVSVLRVTKEEAQC